MSLLLRREFLVYRYARLNYQNTIPSEILMLFMKWYSDKFWMIIKGQSMKQFLCTESTRLKYDFESSQDAFVISCNIQHYQFLLHYVKSYKLLVTVLGMEISKMNVVKCVLMFVLAKMISLSMYNLYWSIQNIHF